MEAVQQLKTPNQTVGHAGYWADIIQSRFQVQLSHSKQGTISSVTGNKQESHIPDAKHSLMPNW